MIADIAYILLVGLILLQILLIRFQKKTIQHQARVIMNMEERNRNLRRAVQDMILDMNRVLPNDEGP